MPTIPDCVMGQEFVRCVVSVTYTPRRSPGDLMPVTGDVGAPESRDELVGDTCVGGERRTVAL